VTAVLGQVCDPKEASNVERVALMPQPTEAL
jgi:hypothetical protein